MIQRIQTLYLAVAGIAVSLAFFFPVITFINEAQIWVEVYLKGISDNSAPVLGLSNTMLLPLQIMGALAAILAFSAIFLFRNRRSQIKFVRLGIVLLLVIIALIFFYYANVMSKITSTTPEFNHAGTYLLLVSLVMFVLANRGIMKDERLVKAADRLR